MHHLWGNEKSQKEYDANFTYRRTGFKMRGLMIAFCVFAYIANSMIGRMDAALCMVCYYIRFIIAFQMIVNPRKSRNSHLIDTRNQKQSCGILQIISIYR